MKTAKPQNTVLLITILLCGIVNSCASRKHVVKNSTIEETNPKLLFLNYTISEDSKGKKNITFINKIIADGRLKNNSNTYLKAGDIGDLKCYQLDGKSKILQSIVVKNPLKKTIEFVNDSMQFESKALKLKKAPLSLRLQLNSKTKSISIKEIIDTLQNTKPLNIKKVF